MKYRVSENIGLQVHDVGKAKQFYENVLGLTKPVEGFGNEIGFRTPYNNLFLIDGEENLGPIMELYVDDLEEAKKHLLENGFEIVRWHGKGKDCYVRDPFGIVFNVWEEKE